MENFKVVCKGIVDGHFADKYGNRGMKDYKGMPILSPPIEFVDPPKGTVCFAIVCEDKDAAEVSGFSWIHWLAANITHDLKEGASGNTPDIVEGVNSCVSIQGGRRPISEVSRYGGMAPPNAPHEYEIHAYALDSFLDLKKGFFINQLYRKMENHILASCTIKGWYRNGK